MRKSIAAAAMVILLAFSALLVPPALSQQNDRPEILDSLLVILEQAQQKVEETFSALTGRDIDIPETARERYDLGLSKAQEATQLIEQDRLDEAQQRILEAIQLYSSAMEEMGADLERTQTPEETEILERAGIQEAIQRLQAIVERLTRIADSVNGTGIDTSGISEKLLEVQNLLQQVNASLNNGEIEAASQGIEQAENATGQALEILEPIVNNVTASLVTDYLEIAQERISSVQDLVLGILENLPVPPFVRDIVAEALSRDVANATDHVNDIKDLIEQGRIEEGLSRLEELRAEIDRLTQELRNRDRNAADAIETLQTRQVSQIALERAVSVLENRDINAAELQSALRESASLIEDAATQLKEGDLEQMQELIELIDEIHDTIRDLIEEALTG